MRLDLVVVVFDVGLLAAVAVDRRGEVGLPLLLGEHSIFVCDRHGLSSASSVCVVRTPPVIHLTLLDTLSLKKITLALLVDLPLLQ